MDDDALPMQPPGETSAERRQRFVTSLFLLEVSRQCRFGVIAWGDLQMSARGRVDEDRVWASVQAFLVAAANVAKLLFPIDKDELARGAELRGLLGVANDSPLAARNMRNVFEHFDERLRRWAEQSPNLTFIDSNLGPIDAIAGVDVSTILRHLDPQRWEVSFRGDVYELVPVASALLHLLKPASDLGHARLLSKGFEPP